MQINFFNMPIMIITIDRKSPRLAGLLSDLNKIGVSNSNIIVIDGVADKSNPLTGCSLSHIRALTTIQPPFLVLEDDARINTKAVFWPNVTVPDDAQMFYLGYSIARYSDAVHQWNIPNVYPFTTNPTEQSEPCETRISKHIYKTRERLCTHAIVYLDMKAVLATIATIVTCIEHNLPHDMGMAKLQTDIPTYAIATPVFVQIDDRQGKEWKYTETSANLCDPFKYP